MSLIPNVPIWLEMILRKTVIFQNFWCTFENCAVSQVLQKQIEYYNHMAYEILANEIGLILPTFPKERRPKRGAILASVLGGLASSIIGLAYECISSFLHHKRHKALNKGVKVMERKTDLQDKKVHHLEDTTFMYGVYNSDTLTELIGTVHRMYNTSTWRERTFAGMLNQWLELYLHQDGIGHYTINSILFLTLIREMYMKMYERFLEQLKMYSKVIIILSKGYFPISLLPPSKLERILSEVKWHFQKLTKIMI